MQILPPIFTFGLLMNKEELKRKKIHGLPYLSLSLYINVIFSISNWLLNASNTMKKGYNEVPWSFMFLRMPLPSFCIKSKFLFTWKTRPIWTFNTPYSAIDITYLPYILTLCLADLPHTVGSHCRILGSWGIMSPTFE